METQFGLAHVWSQGDIVTKSVAVLLLLMSLMSWMVIITKALDLRRLSSLAKATESFWHSADFADGLAKFGTDPANPFRLLAVAGREATAHVLHKDDNAKPQLHDALDLSEWVTRSLRNSMDDIIAKMQSGLAVLASVGSTAPFVGLFGTVWGIYHALLAIGLNGQASIDKVAGPVGESLIMTALGLAVAIPAVLGYNALVRGNKSVSGKLNRFAHDLHAYFVTGARVSGPASVNVVAMRKGS
ncbi:MotA/TolQ/ExbB proton channel family protein [Polaromonas sp. CG9_12]|nr:MotA/TolQ/ExbB proton channel family protein [Polaromonas sp. CG9_12]